MKAWMFAAATLVAVGAFAQTTDGEGWQHGFPVDDYSLTARDDHEYWSLKPGRFVVLASIEPDGSEVVVISVLDETEMVGGVETRVVEEREYEDGHLAEISRNFYATAEETGDVFYFGEDVDYYKDGEVVGHEGEWRAGVDGARAGLYMPARPAAGMKYYMEYAPSAAMDRAEIIDTSATVETPGGTYRDSLIVTESSPLEPGDESYKRYAPKVGMIYDDGLELYKHGRRFPSERYIEFEITEDEMPKVPLAVVYELHPTGVIREVKVEIRKMQAFYAIETFIDGEQWDVEVLDDGQVRRNTLD